MTIFNQVLWISLGLFILLLPYSHASSGYYKPGSVTIGALLPIHKSTDENVCSQLNAYGLGFAETLIYCIEQINKNPDILRDIDLGYDIRDYCESPTIGMKMTHEFVKQNFIIDLDMGACGNKSAHSKYTSNSAHAQNKSLISAVIGAHDSGTTVLVAELLGVVDIPIISPFSTSEQLTPYKTFFRTIPPDGLQARAMADLIDAFNWSYVGVVAVDHSYGRYGVMYLEKEAQKRTFCTGTVEYFPRILYQNKMETIIYKLKRQKLVRAVVLWANSGQSIAFLKKAMEMGLHDKVWILSDDVSALSGSEFTKIGVTLRGVFLGIAHRHYNYDEILNHFEKQLTNPPKTALWNEFFQLEFNCTLSGFEPKGLPICSQKHLNLSRALEGLYNPYSPYLVDAVRALGVALNAMYNCSDTPTRKCPKTSPFINSEDLLNYIKNVSFRGVTGDVGFDKNGNPVSSSYDIIHLRNNSHSNFVKSPIGTWSLNKGLQPKRIEIKWSFSENKPPESICMSKCAPGTFQTAKKNCCWECLPCEEGEVSEEYAAESCRKCPGLTVASSKRNECLKEVVINVTLESDTGIIFAVISGLGILFSLLSLLLFIKYHTTPLVKASNRELSFLLLAIIISGFAMSILHLSLPTESICKFRKIWRYTIHCLCISILFIKTIRLSGAFQLDLSGLPKLFKRFVINSKLQVLTLVILNTCPVTLALLWSFLDSPYILIERREINHRIEHEYFCKPYRDEVGMGLQLASLCYLIIITLACIYHAFKARHLPGNFNETRYIGSSLYILLISWLAYYPINSVLKGWYATVISSATGLLSWYGLLLCIFGPKIYIILIQPHMNTNEFVRAELRTANRGMNSVSAQSQCTDRNYNNH